MGHKRVTQVSLCNASHTNYCGIIREIDLAAAQHQSIVDPDRYCDRVIGFDAVIIDADGRFRCSYQRYRDKHKDA